MRADLDWGELAAELAELAAQLPGPCGAWLDDGAYSGAPDRLVVVYGSGLDANGIGDPAGMYALAQARTVLADFGLHEVAYAAHNNEAWALLAISVDGEPVQARHVALLGLLVRDARRSMAGAGEQ